MSSVAVTAIDPPPAHDPAPESVAVLGSAVGYTGEGPADAPALIMIPGVPGDSFDFRYLAPVLAANFRVYRIELPGFGCVRDQRWRDYSPAGRAALIAGFADAIGLERYSVLGHSMGGAAAAALAATDAERVSALVLLCSIGLRRHRGMTLPPLRAHLMSAFLRVPGLRYPVVRNARAWYRRAGFPGADSYSARDLRIHLAHVASYDFAAAERVATSITRPTLVVYADDDPMIETEISKELAAAIPTSTGLCYASGGHNLQKSRARELAREIAAFLRR